MDLFPSAMLTYPLWTTLPLPLSINLKSCRIEGQVYWPCMGTKFFKHGLLLSRTPANWGIARGTGSTTRPQENKDSLTPCAALEERRWTHLIGKQSSMAPSLYSAGRPRYSDAMPKSCSTDYGGLSFYGGHNSKT